MEFKYKVKVGIDLQDVAFKNPVSKGDLIVVEGKSVHVFSVSHTDGGESVIDCERIKG